MCLYMHVHVACMALMQGSNLMVARSPLVTENDNVRLKIHSKVDCLANVLFLFFKYIVQILFRQVKVLSPLDWMAT